MNRFGRAVKRSLDVAASAAGLVCLSPVLASAALAIYATMGRPIFFRQERPGLHGVPFTMHKLRTMRVPRSGEVFFRTDADRLTPLGRFLRQTSIDELPELYDVLRGAMSLVGPRPLLLEYLPRYTAEQRRRHDVRPGITGWAQVNGRQHVKFGRRFELDVWYVDHQSVWLDLRILAMTAREIFRKSNIVHGQTVEEVDDIGLAPPAAPKTNGVHAS